MAIIDRYYVGQGDAALYVRTSAGKRSLGRLLGNCTKIELKGTQSEITHVESRTGKRLTDNKIVWGDKVMMTVTFDNFSKENLAWLFTGQASTGVGGSVTGEPQPYAPVMQLDNFNVTPTGVSAKKTGAATPWAANTYTVSSTGLVQIVTDPPVAGVVPGDSILFDYTYGASEKVTGASGYNPEYWFSTHAINKAESDNPVLLNCFKVKFMSNYQFELIGETYGTLAMDGEVLYDAKQTDPLNRYFEERMIALA